MKKLCLLIILPLVCLAFGYGAGEFLGNPGAAQANETHGPTDEPIHKPNNDEHADSTTAPESTIPIVVKLGQMIVPVYKAHSVTYIVANLGVTVPDLKIAEHYNLGENGAKLRDAIFTILKHAAEGRALRGVTIDTEKLSKHITAELKLKFSEINDVLFLAFYKKDVART